MKCFNKFHLVCITVAAYLRPKWASLNTDNAVNPVIINTCPKLIIQVDLTMSALNLLKLESVINKPQPGPNDVNVYMGDAKIPFTNSRGFTEKILLNTCPAPSRKLKRIKNSTNNESIIHIA